jgi:hypothetical protein
MKHDLKNSKNRSWYVDPLAGDDANDGLSPSRPVRSYASREIAAGDAVLFKRGSVIREMLHTHPGQPGRPVRYGAYGEGADPVFLGSMAANDPGAWREVRAKLWRYEGALTSEVCNLVFDGGKACGTLRWVLEELRDPGEWHDTSFGVSSAAESSGGPAWQGSELYLCSEKNPALAWSAIECVLWGERKLVDGRHLILEDLRFENAGVHGYQEFGAEDVVMRRCAFRFIGGAVWNREQQIRFGNAIEFWDGAGDITIEHCRFDSIYDSGVTHQGGGTTHIPERLFFRHNQFSNCGMAAYECREPSREVYFEYNNCHDAGCGFSMLGVTPPRQSEIWPQPMGHHVFIWRIDPGTQPGKVYIRHNTFGAAPHGSAIYSIIDPADEAKIVIDQNHYDLSTGPAQIHIGSTVQTGDGS